MARSEAWLTTETNNLNNQDIGAGKFINKGTNKRWKDTLTDEDVKAFEDRALDELGQECYDWICRA